MTRKKCFIGVNERRSGVKNAIWGKILDCGTHDVDMNGFQNFIEGPGLYKAVVV